MSTTLLTSPVWFQAVLCIFCSPHLCEEYRAHFMRQIRKRGPSRILHWSASFINLPQHAPVVVAYLFCSHSNPSHCPFIQMYLLLFSAFVHSDVRLPSIFTAPCFPRCSLLTLDAESCCFFVHPVHVFTLRHERMERTRYVSSVFSYLEFVPVPLSIPCFFNLCLSLSSIFAFSVSGAFTCQTTSRPMSGPFSPCPGCPS